MGAILNTEGGEDNKSDIMTTLLLSHRDNTDTPDSTTTTTDIPELLPQLLTEVKTMLQSGTSNSNSRHY